MKFELLHLYIADRFALPDGCRSSHLLLPVQATSIASVMNGVGNSPLDALRQLLLNLLRNNGSLTSSLGVRLVGGLARLGASRMDLASISALFFARLTSNLQPREAFPRDPGVPFAARLWGPWNRLWHGTCPGRARSPLASFQTWWVGCCGMDETFNS